MSEFENDDKKNSEFKIPTTETETPKVEDKAEVNPDSKIGKPIESRDSTPQEKSESQRVLVEKIQKRVEGMKTDLAKMEENLPLVESVDKLTNEADAKDKEQIKLIQAQLQSGEDGYAENISQQEQVGQEAKDLRDKATKAREDVFKTMPNGQRDPQELRQNIYNLKEDLKQQEDILEANKKELDEMSK